MNRNEIVTKIKEFVSHTLNDNNAWSPAWEFKNHESAAVHSRDLAKQLVQTMGISSTDLYYQEAIENIENILAKEFRNAGCKVIQQDGVLKIFRSSS